MYVLRDKEKLEYFKSIVPGHLTNEIIELYKQKYGEEMSKWKVQGLKKTYKLYSNVNTQFKKGECQGSQYFSPIGSERKIQNGNILVKIAEPNVWKLKHRYIYENKYGKIPKNKMIIFLDGNKNNFDINNLKLIDRNEHLIAIKKDLYFNNKELTETGIIIAKLMNKTCNIKKQD